MFSMGRWSIPGALVTRYNNTRFAQVAMTKYSRLVALKPGTSNYSMARTSTTQSKVLGHFHKTDYVIMKPNLPALASHSALTSIRGLRRPARSVRVGYFAETCWCTVDLHCLNSLTPDRGGWWSASLCLVPSVRGKFPEHSLESLACIP